MKQKIAAALLILMSTTSGWLSSAQAEELPVVMNFTLEAKESADKKVPILLLYKSKSCIFCVRVLQEFLLPMQRNPEYAGKVIMRQIDIGSTDKIIDFDGKTTTQSRLAKSHGVTAVPTVIFFDDKGKELSRITGLLGADFYQAYLDNAINDSQAKMKPIIDPAR